MEERKQRKFNEKLKILRKINERISRLNPSDDYCRTKDWMLSNKREQLYWDIRKNYECKRIYPSVDEKGYYVHTKPILNEIKDIKSVNDLYGWYEYKGTLLAFAIHELNINYINILLDKGARIDVENVSGSKPTYIHGNQEFYTINYLLNMLENHKEEKPNEINVRNILNLLLRKGLLIERIEICENLFREEPNLAKYYYNRMKVHKMLILRIKLPEEIHLYVFNLLYGNVEIYNRLKNLLR